MILLFFSLQLSAQKIRKTVDTIGFCTHKYQIDSIIARTSSLYPVEQNNNLPWKLAVCTHDDYAYAAGLYAEVLQNVKAKIVIIFAVSHKARLFGHENKIVFDSYDAWDAPAGPVPVSPLRDQLISLLPKDDYTISDSSQCIEHSAEAMVPFLQYFNPTVQIVPILIPYMSWNMQLSIASRFADALNLIMNKKRMRLGKDVCILISNDAVHYGDKDWGAKFYAPFGVDSAGYKLMLMKEKSLMDSVFSSELDTARIHYLFNSLTQPNNYKEYKRTWCGRYSVPFGMLVASFLNTEMKLTITDYATSLGGAGIPIDEINIGKTADASLRHWVGYLIAAYQ
ncbi:MAG: AmmeMemoRadiSam system protein B [Bacteroidota bacterium]